MNASGIASSLCGGAQPPRFEFYDPQTPIYTSPRFLPPAKIVKSRISDAIVSHGSYLEECTVANAIVGLRSRIDKGAVIQARGGMRHGFFLGYCGKGTCPSDSTEPALELSHARLHQVVCGPCLPTQPRGL